MGKEVIILILQAIAMYLLVLGAHSLRHRWGPVHFYALLGGITAIMSWVTDAGLTVDVGGISFVVGSTVFYTSLLLGVFVVYVFDGPHATRIAISTVIGVSILMPLTAAVLRFQMSLGNGNSVVPVPAPSLRINTASVLATFLDLIFLGVAWEFLGKPGLRMKLGFRAWLTLLGVMWLDVLLFATGAFAGTPAYLRIMRGTAVSRLAISLFALPFLYGYLYWQSNLKGVALERRPVLAILREVAEMKVELTEAQREIEKRKRAEAALRESQALLEATGRMANVGGWRLNVGTGEVSWTEQTYRIHEVVPEGAPSLEEAISFFHVEDRDRLREAIARAIDAGEAYDMEMRLVTARGRERWIRTVCRPQVAQGQTVELKGTIQDITERKRMERKLGRQKRLAAVGQMAAGIAHDFRNRLNSIMLHTQLALRSRELPPRLREKLDAIIEESRGMVDLVQQIVDFSSRAMMHLKPVDLATVTEDAVESIRAQLRDDVRVTVEIETEEAFVEADAGRLRQVLANLAENSQDAMPEGGEIHIGLSHVTVEPDEVGESVPEGDVLGVQVPPGEYVRLTVSDTGTGMTDRVREHLFEPFFTTKDVDEGTGLGLAQVYGIVRQHRGIIHVETELDEGTTVVIYLPAWVEGAAAGEEVGSEAPVAAGATILLVENDDAVRQAGQEVLESLGYRVMVAKSGREALDLVESPRWSVERVDRPDLVISELSLPGIGGEELVRRLRKRAPGLKALAVAQDSVRNGRLEALRRIGFSDAITKPFSVEALASTVQQILADRGA